MSYEPKLSVTEELIRCRVWIENALAYSGDTHNFDDIVLGVLNHNYHFWPLENSCVITEFNVFPKQKTLHVFLAGGRLNEILALSDPLDNFAKANGCVALTIAGRPGWEKVLDKLGWKFQFATLKKEI